MVELEVETNHSFTGRMCAGTRANEHLRQESLFEDPLAEIVAGESGMAQPMGDWILVPRTRYGDDFLVRKYFQQASPCRQLVLLGAGMDTRAFRRFALSEDHPASQLTPLPELVVFEVDQPTTFHVKENLLSSAKGSDAYRPSVRDRKVIPVDFNDATKSWVKELVRNGFEPNVPTVWLLEGLVYYLPQDVVQKLFQDIGQLSAPGSGVFHDAVSATQVSGGRNPAPAGAPFISGSDDYAGMWRSYGRYSTGPGDNGFDMVQVRNFESVNVDRRRRCLWRAPYDSSHEEHGPAHAYEKFCRGKCVKLFVTAEKSAATC